MQAPTAGWRAVRLMAPQASSTWPGTRVMAEAGVCTSPTLQPQPQQPRPPSASRRAVSFAEALPIQIGDVTGGNSGGGLNSIDGGSGGASASAFYCAARPSSAGGAKRVGFNLSASGESGGDAPAFNGVSRRKAEQLRREQSNAAQQRGRYDAREAAAATADATEALPALPDSDYSGASGLGGGGGDGGGDDSGHMMPRAMRKGGLARSPGMGHPLGSGSGSDDDGGALGAATGAADIAAGLDLSLLAAHLCPPEMVPADESDSEWDPDALLSALAAELAPGGGGGGPQADRDELRQI